MHLLEKVGPEALRVYAAALEHRRSFGEWPSAAVIAELARREGASVGASLVLTRYELHAQNGRLVSLGGDPQYEPAAVVPDVETLWAILLREKPRVRLVDPDGAPIWTQDILRRAQAWEAERSSSAAR